LRTGERCKPRVLLVDDHPGVLDKVAAVLASDVEVAGITTSGRQAIAMADQIAPDAIVLDINMPGLDGYGTKSALDEAGSCAPVVFLSMFDSEEHVGEAFRRGGRGYVLKPHVTRDLASALHHVLLGRRFVPSLESLFRLADGACHAMQLYRDSNSFLDGLAGFFDLALRRGDATCVIATKDLRNGLSDRLRSRGWDLNGSSVQKRYLVFDAADAIGKFMRNGVPDSDRLAEIALELDRYRLSVSGGATSRLTVFGNMVALVSADFSAAAAVALERQWNSLTRGLPFFTLCGYSASCVQDLGELCSDACAEHWAVSHANGL
jgi:CheY-like chemotaxis protein